jgi:hypothetical protein
MQAPVTSGKKRMTATTSKQTRKNAFIILVMIVFMTLPGSVQARQIRACLVSRLEFSPTLLDMIRRVLSEKTKMDCSLTFQNTDNASSAGNSEFDILVIEKGINSINTSGFTSSDKHVELVWVMAARGRALPLVNSRFITRREFVEILETLKKESPDRFPWFEALCSRITWRNFCLLLDHDTAGNKSSHKPLWLENNATSFLYRLIENELLNPLSVEADVSLAESVFYADDACFFSCWTEASRLTDQFNEGMGLQRVFHFPFPASDEKPVVPRIKLEIWHKTSDRQAPSSVSNASSTFILPFAFIDLDYAADMQWIEKNFSEKYDSLIMGDL